MTELDLLCSRVIKHRPSALLWTVLPYWLIIAKMYVTIGLLTSYYNWNSLVPVLRELELSQNAFICRWRRTWSRPSGAEYTKI